MYNVPLQFTSKGWVSTIHSLIPNLGPSHQGLGCVNRCHDTTKKFFRKIIITSVNLL